MTGQLKNEKMKDLYKILQMKKMFHRTKIQTFSILRKESCIIETKEKSESLPGNTSN